MADHTPPKQQIAVSTKLSERLSSTDRAECRAFARLFNTADGKTVLDVIKRDMGWDEAGPENLAKQVEDGRNEHALKDEWIGGRRLVRAIIARISKGKQLSEEDEE